VRTCSDSVTVFVIILYCYCCCCYIGRNRFQALYSSGLAVVLHLVSAIFIIKDVIGYDELWGLRIISGLCTGGNTVAYGWEVLYSTKFIHH